jgi:hypothetical protein
LLLIIWENFAPQEAERHPILGADCRTGAGTAYPNTGTGETTDAGATPHAGDVSGAIFVFIKLHLFLEKAILLFFFFFVDTFAYHRLVVNSEWLIPDPDPTF